MAIYLSRKKGGTVATPITPSNSSPAQMTANVAVNPTGNGYAIESYSSITPSNSSPATITSGSIYKTSANGRVIENFEGWVSPNNEYPPEVFPDSVYYIPSFFGGYVIRSYDSKTPSDSTPPTVSSGDIVKMGGAGYLYATQQSSPTSITPSNSSPVALTANTPVKPTASGYAISSYSSKTPSDNTPPSISSGAIIKASAAGYLYSKVQPKMGLAPDLVKEYSNMANNATQTFSVTQKPRYITFFFTYYASTKGGMFLVLDVLSSKAYRYGYWGSGFHNEDYSSSYSSYITSVSSSSVTVKNSWGGAGNVAVGVYY